MTIEKRICCVFWVVFRCCGHPKSSHNTIFICCQNILLNISMIFKKVLFDDFDWMLLLSLQKRLKTAKTTCCTKAFIHTQHPKAGQNTQHKWYYAKDIIFHLWCYFKRKIWCSVFGAWTFSFLQEKEKIINRSNIYSRQFLTPSASYGNLGYGSISAGNSVASLRAPSGSGQLTSRSKARSKSYQTNIGKTGRCFEGFFLGTF